MKVVITGATGFVGQWLINELLQQGDDITIIARNPEHISEEWRKRIHIVKASLWNLKDLRTEDFTCETADIFFHLGWAGTSGLERADYDLQIQNLHASCEAVKLAKRLQCGRFVNAGSIMEYEVIHSIPQDAVLPGMGNVYSVAKLAADFLGKIIATNEGIDYINVIISNIYGAGERSARFLNTTLKKMLNNKEIPLTHCRQMYDFIYVSDAVKAIALAGKIGEKNSAIYIGNTEQYPLKDFIIQMKEVLGSQSELLFGKVPLTGATIEYNDFDSKKLEKMGFKPEISFAHGIELTRDWILEEDNEH